MSVLTKEEEALVAEAERVEKYLAGFNISLATHSALVALVRRLVGRVEDSDSLWQPVYDMAKRHCWDEASEGSPEEKIWSALMRASPQTPEEGSGTK